MQTRAFIAEVPYLTWHLRPQDSGQPSFQAPHSVQPQPMVTVGAGRGVEWCMGIIPYFCSSNRFGDHDL